MKIYLILVGACIILAYLYAEYGPVNKNNNDTDPPGFRWGD